MPASSNQHQGLVLEDYFHYMEETRSGFQLPAPEFGLKEIQAHAGTDAAIKRIIKDTADRHGAEVYSKPHPLLAETNSPMYSAYLKTAVYSGHRIHPQWVERALRRALEVGLQTIVQLPSHFPKPAYRLRQLKSLASALGRVGQKANAASAEAEVRERLKLHFQGNSANHVRFLRLGDELQWAAATLQSLTELKLVRIPMGSPNPQVRVALYTVRWFEACTRRKHYETFKTLTGAAFYTVGMQRPRWVDRLEVEAVLEARHRRNWVKRISR
jgi:hypothetical protein